MGRGVSIVAMLVVISAILVGSSADPWTPAQAVEPAALARELTAKPAAGGTRVVCVGFPTLYKGGHVPGAEYHGPASTAQGLADLKRWAEHLPRTSDIVLYCGCCPFSECPNIRPAYTALRDAGSTRLRVLVIPHNFGVDWADNGLPVAR